MLIEILHVGTDYSIWVSHNYKNIVIDGKKSTSAINWKMNDLHST